MSRHGKIAPNKSRVSVLLDDGDKAALAEMAKNDGRSLSNLYALTGSIEDVARALLHHTTRITLKHYVAMGIKKVAAKRFFGLRPA